MLIWRSGEKHMLDTGVVIVPTGYAKNNHQHADIALLGNRITKCWNTAMTTTFGQDLQKAFRWMVLRVPKCLISRM